MSSPRPTKRARQACEPCRRRKSRCTGERPTCSYCLRLGHACEYAAPEEEIGPVKEMEQRISSLEGQVRALTGAFNRQSTQQATASSESIKEQQPVIPDIPTESGTADATQLFMRYLNFQPLHLFNQKSFPATTMNQNPQLCLAVKALGLRFNDRGLLDDVTDRQIQHCTESSRNMVTRCIAEGGVELPTLQALCLLTLIDYTNDNIIRAGLGLQTARYLIQNLRCGRADFPSNLEHEQDELELCYWAVRMLENLQPNPRHTTMSGGSLAKIASLPPKKDLGLVAYTIMLGEVWGLSRAYASTHVSPNAPPPWSPHSDYSTITFHHMEFESRVPLQHRLHASRFPEISAAEFDARREYWGPWISYQLVFHAVPCLLNHPLLLSMRLRSFRHIMPQSFLRSSFEQITLHAGWVLHFIDLLQEKHIKVYDPTLGECIVIVATIFLQHSFVDDVVFQEKANVGYQKCMTFLHELAVRWPHIDRRVSELKRLRESISTSTTQDLPQTWSVNVNLLWNILVSTPERHSLDNTSRDIFGPALAKKRIPHSLLLKDKMPGLGFDLVGSAGISGHRTVAKELVTYAPDSLSRPYQNLGAQIDVPGLTSDYSLEPTGPPDADFLQPEDYGRLIESWLTFEPGEV